jgi:hypothetical protein
MEARDRVFGPITRETATDEVSVDYGDLIRKLVLSEHFVLESDELKEFPLLVRKFGYDGVRELLDSGLIGVYCGFAGVAFAGDDLPLDLYRPLCISFPPEKDVQRALDSFDDIPGLSGKQARTLRTKLADLIIEPQSNVGIAMLAKLHADIETNSPILKTAVAQVIADVTDRVSAASVADDFSLTITPTSYHGYAKEPMKKLQVVEAQTDLGERFGLSRLETHDIIGSAITGIGSLNRRIELMEQLDAVTGFRSSELPLFEQKLSFLARQLDPDVEEQRFSRVVELADLPDVDPDPDCHDVDLSRLVDIAQGDSARAFRSWLRGIDRMSDEEIKGEIGNLRDTMRSAVHSPAGKAVRFGVTAGVSLVHGVGPIAAQAAGALDTFVFDKLISRPGPTAFVSQLYPSVFTRATAKT